MNNSIKEKKSEIASLGRRADQMKGKVSDIKNKHLERMQKEERA